MTVWGVDSETYIYAAAVMGDMDSPLRGRLWDW